MEFYNLGKEIITFTTDRNQGRDMERIRASIIERFPTMQGGMKRGLYPHQTHTDQIFHITEEFLSLSQEEIKAQLEGIDAIISNVKDTILGISTADCIPVLVYDPEHHAAAAIHAGWKGTVKRIAMKAVSQMEVVFNTDPSKCTAAIGPGISLESFEVGDEVGAIFMDEGFELCSVSRRMPKMNTQFPGAGMKLHLDLKEINRQQLMSAGILEENINVSAIDTYTDERFFSARREQKGDVKCGRILTGFVIL